MRVWHLRYGAESCSLVTVKSYWEAGTKYKYGINIE